MPLRRAPLWLMLCALLTGSLYSAVPSEADLLKIAGDAQAGVVERTKAFADLRAVATDGSIPALVAMLGDPKLSYPARSVIESLPGPAADRALLGALASAKDDLLRVGLVNSLGSRHTVEAVPALAGLLRSPNVMLASAALNALGNIGTVAAADALRTCEPAPGLMLVWADAVLRAAEALQTSDHRRAITLYRLVSTTAAPPQRAAAAIALARLADQPVREVAALLASDDLATRAVALGTIRAGELGTPLVEEVGRVFPSLRPDVQVQLLSVLYDRGDRAAASIGRQALKAAETDVRAAAANLLSGVGSAQDAPALLEMMTGPDEPGPSARLALTRIPGEEVTARLMERFREDTAARPAALEVLVARGHRPLLVDLLDPGIHADETLRPLAANALGVLATGGELEKVLALHRVLPVENRGALDGAVRRIAAKHASADSASAVVAAAAQQLPPAEAASLYAILAGLGGERSLAILAGLATAPEPELRRIALGAMASARDIRATDTLLAAARGDAEPANRALAVRSATAVFSRSVEPDNPVAARTTLPAAVAGLRKAWELAERRNEKSAIVAALRKLRDPSARAAADELEKADRP